MIFIFYFYFHFHFHFFGDGDGVGEIKMKGEMAKYLANEREGYIYIHYDEN